MTRPIHQITGRPIQTDQRDKLTGDDYEITGFIEVGEISGNAPAVPEVAGGPTIAHFLNNASPFLSSGYHHFDSAYSDQPDPGWFEWPVGGTDHTRVRLLEPGIYNVFASSDGSGGSTHLVIIEAGIFGNIGSNYNGSTGSSLVSANGSTDVYPSAINPSGTEVDVRVAVFGPTGAQGRLTIVRWPSPYYVSTASGGFAWEEVTY